MRSDPPPQSSSLWALNPAASTVYAALCNSLTQSTCSLQPPLPALISLYAPSLCRPLAAVLILALTVVCCCCCNHHHHHRLSCPQTAKAYCREVVRILRTLKARRDMSVNEARLIVSIEDPRTREQRQLGIEVRGPWLGEGGG